MTQAKPRLRAMLAQPVASVLHHRFRHPRQPGIAHVVLHPVHFAERQQSGTARLVRCEPQADVLLGEHVEMEAQLRVELPLVPAAPEQ